METFAEAMRNYKHIVGMDTAHSDLVDATAYAFMSRVMQKKLKWYQRVWRFIKRLTRTV